MLEIDMHLSSANLMLGDSIFANVYLPAFPPVTQFLPRKVAIWKSLEMNVSSCTTGQEEPDPSLFPSHGFLTWDSYTVTAESSLARSHQMEKEILFGLLWYVCPVSLILQHGQGGDQKDAENKIYKIYKKTNELEILG